MRGFTVWPACWAAARALLRAEDRGINKPDGLPWKVIEILQRAQSDIAAGLSRQ